MQSSKLQVLNNVCKDEDSACSCCAVDFFKEKPPLWKRRQLIRGSISGAALIAGLLIDFFTGYGIVAQILFLSVIALAGREIIEKAYRSLISRSLDMNFLMSIAAIGAFFIGHGEEGAAVIFLFFVAETLEEIAADNARNSISRLLKLAPETANVKREGEEIELHVHAVTMGETIAVRPGEKIPLDGRITAGHSSINEAQITGESVPVEKTEGDEVYAGTLNEEGYLELTVSKISENTLLSRIIKLTEEAERKKSRTEKSIDKFARIYTPTVIALAGAAFLIPPLVLGHDWGVWFYRALVLLVISCPCALAISTPVAMVSAITSGTKNGVLIKGATFIEELNRVKAIAFDKTGTLTMGKLEVEDIVGFNGHSAEEVLSIAASLESRSEHPIAKAIIKHASQSGSQIREVHMFRSFRGKGLEGQINGKKYYIGSKILFKDLFTSLPAELAGHGKEGKISVFISDDRSAVGVVLLADQVRNNASKIITDLKNMHIRTEMLTGDNRKVARVMAEQIGIDDYYAGLLPEDKVKVIEKLGSKFGHVAMVGDGVNDAPALAVSNVGIAMGGAGTDVAIETADITLMHDDLSMIDYLIMLSRKTMSVVRQNIALSVIIKVSLTLMAIAGMINLWVAVGVGDMGLSLAVILNAMRLTKLKA
jgi:Cd2+/Zn2+-exporting ATPase